MPHAAEQDVCGSARLLASRFHYWALHQSFHNAGGTLRRSRPARTRLHAPPAGKACRASHCRCFAKIMSAAQLAETLRPSGGRAAAQAPRVCGLRAPRQPSRFRAPCSTRQPRRQQRAGGGAVAAAAPAAAAAAAAGPLLSPALVFDAATLLVLPFYALMIAAPRRQLTQRLFSTPALFTVAAALYALLLAMWRPLPAIAAVAQGAAAAVTAAAGSSGGWEQALRAALPSMPAFAALFGSPEITALAWVHLVLLDLLQARWVWRRAGKQLGSKLVVQFAASRVNCAVTHACHPAYPSNAVLWCLAVGGCTRTGGATTSPPGTLVRRAPHEQDHAVWLVLRATTMASNYSPCMCAAAAAGADKFLNPHICPAPPPHCLQPCCASWWARWACCATYLRKRPCCAPGGAAAAATNTLCTASDAAQLHAELCAPLHLCPAVSCLFLECASKHQHCLSSRLAMLHHALSCPSPCLTRGHSGRSCWLGSVFVECMIHSWYFAEATSAGVGLYRKVLIALRGTAEAAGAAGQGV